MWYYASCGQWHEYIFILYYSHLKLALLLQKIVLVNFPMSTTVFKKVSRTQSTNLEEFRRNFLWIKYIKIVTRVTLPCLCRNQDWQCINRTIRKIEELYKCMLKVELVTNLKRSYYRLDLRMKKRFPQTKCGAIYCWKKWHPFKCVKSKK